MSTPASAPKAPPLFSFRLVAALVLVPLLSIIFNPATRVKDRIIVVGSRTTKGKFMVGYQGWFACHGDGPPLSPEHHGWIHWFDKPLDDGGRPTFDMWPATRELTAGELYEVPGLTLPSGAPAQLFSSRHPLTTRRHFRWMREHSISGAFLQRFLSEVRDGDTPMRRQRDEVGRRVREAAEAEGRVWAIMWDLSGTPSEDIERALKADWEHLVKDERILESSSYLHEGQRPVVGIWGMGFADRGINPEALIRVIKWLRESVAEGVWLMAGTPTYWHRGIEDMDPDPRFDDVWQEVDAISPWAVGRFSDINGAIEFHDSKTMVDLEIIRAEDEARGDGKQREYVPVVFPGFSWKNLHSGPLNQIPRLSGKFLWHQLHLVHQLLFNLEERMVYGAMFDEYDEATALMPSETTRANLPREITFLATDADGEDLPDNWFLRICGLSARALAKGQQLPEVMPRKELEAFSGSTEVGIERPLAGDEVGVVDMRED